MKSILAITLIILIAGCEAQQTMKLTSNAFQNNGKIPDRYTCKGENINPKLAIADMPAGTKSMVLIMDDPDAPAGTWDHWIVFNIPAISDIAENSVPEGATQGKNSWGKSGYGGPCPPSGTHRYVFKAYALDTTLNLSGNARKQDVEKAMKGHALAEAKLTGLYSK